MILLVVVVESTGIVFGCFACVDLGFVFNIGCFVTVLIDSIDSVLPGFAIGKHRFELHFEIEWLCLKLRVL